MEHSSSPAEEQQPQAPFLFDPIYELRSPERTLGYAAVAQANKHASVIDQMGSHVEGSRAYRLLNSLQGNLRFDMACELQHVRATLRQIEGREEDIMGRYFNETVSQYVFNVIKQHERPKSPEVSWKHWLTELADDEVLLNILQQHNYAVEQQATSQRIELAFEISKHFFATTVSDMYENGDIALPSKRIDEIDLVVGDVFDTLMKERSGYFQPGVAEVVLAQGQQGAKRPGEQQQPRQRLTPRQVREQVQQDREQALLKEFPRVLTHEFVHALLCRTYEVPGNPLAARWINEAETEVLSRLIRQAQGLTVKEDKVYQPERELRELLLSKAPNPEFAAKLLMRAFTGEEHDTDIFVAHINTVWGADDVMEKIHQAVAFEEKRLVIPGVSIDRLVHAEALRVVHERLRDTPEKILLPGVDSIQRQLARAAQEPKK